MDNSTYEDRAMKPPKKNFKFLFVIFMIWAMALAIFALLGYPTLQREYARFHLYQTSLIRDWGARAWLQNKETTYWSANIFGYDVNPACEFIGSSNARGDLLNKTLVTIEVAHGGVPITAESRQIGLPDPSILPPENTQHLGRWEFMLPAVPVGSKIAGTVWHQCLGQDTPVETLVGPFYIGQDTEKGRPVF